MTKPQIIEGKVVVIRDNNGNPIDDIDTDMIFHNKHLHITNIEEMGGFAFGNLKGWEEFPSLVANNNYTILVVGKNFGAGSSRQQAVDCFTSLGIKLIIGESFGAIYKRNAINSGLPIMIATDIMEKKEVKNGVTIKIDLKTGKIEDKTLKKTLITATPLSKVQLDIYQAGSLFAYGRNLG